MNKKIYLDKVSVLFLSLSVFFLPLDLNKNNIFLVLFLAFFTIKIILNRNEINFNSLKNNYKKIIIYTFPFWLVLLGAFWTLNIDQAKKEILKVLPFLFLIPFSYLDKEFFKKHFKVIMYSLVVGTFLAGVIFMYKIVSNINLNNKKWSVLFDLDYRYTHQFISFSNVHKSYLALFILISQGFLVSEIKAHTNSKVKYRLFFVIFVLTLFLIILFSRTAIIIFTLSISTFLFLNKNYKMFILSALTVASSIYIIDNIKDNKLRDYFIKSINIFEKKTIFSKKDNRFERLKVSFNLFKQNPILGCGTANDDSLRLKQYYINRDSEAYNNNYNAHNQFFEYLSTYGLLGALLYISIYVLIFKTILNNDKKYLFLFFFTSFFIANLTESMFERSWGVVCFSLLLALLIAHKKNEQHV